MKQHSAQVSQNCRASIGLISCQTAWPPKGGPSVHIYQVWHRLQQMGYEVHTWGEQAIPGSCPYPRTEAGLATLLANVDLLYVRFWFDEDFTTRIVARLLANRRMPMICEFNAPLYETTTEWPPGTLWTLRHKAVLYARNHLLVRTCVDHAICVSNVMADYVRREFSLEKVTVLPNGGDPELFTPALRAEGRAAMGLTDDDFVVFWGGSTVFDWQGISLMLGAAELLTGQRVRFVLAGDPDHLPRPLPAQVMTVGKRSYFDMPLLVAASDVCLAVYRAYDWCPIGFFGSALKLFDYMACGRAVIASNMGQIAEVIQDGENGLLTDGRPEDIAAKIEFLRLNPDRREAMGRAARQTVLQRYSCQGVAQRTAAVIEGLLSKRAVRRKRAATGCTTPTIGFFGPYEKYGGTEEYLNKLMRPMAEMGYKVVFFHREELPEDWITEVGKYARTVAYSGTPSESGTRLQGADTALSVSGELRAFHRAWTPREVRYLLGFLREARRLQAVFEASPVDILHSPDLGVEPFLFAARWAGIRRVTGALGCMPPTDRFRNSAVYRWLESACLRRVDAIAAVSESGARAWVSRTRLRRGTMRVIHNGIQVNRLERVAESSSRVRSELSVPLSARLIGVSAALAERKGHRYLVAALPQVLARVPDAYLLFAGEGPCEASLRRQARQLGIHDRVLFLGHRTDILRIVQAYDIVALPSVSIESMPFALLEGMSYGKPAVGTAIGGIPELIEHGVSGYIVPPRDPDALARAIIDVLANPDTTARMGRAAVERVRTHFTVEKMVRETLDLILGVAPQNPVRAAENSRSRAADVVHGYKKQ